jgi:SpoVK/Ycf46/Vps4 family AAA+-type ATPase
VGGLDHNGLKTIFEHYLSTTNAGDVDSDMIVREIPFYTPADIEYLFQKVTHTAFERELVIGRDYQITTEMFLEKIPEVKPSLTDKITEEFERDCREFTRY